MDTVIKAQADELNMSLIDFIRGSFSGKKVTLHIYEDVEMNQTEYLLSDPESSSGLPEPDEDGMNKRNLGKYSIQEIAQDGK